MSPEGTVPHILVATDICRTFMAALRLVFPSDVILPSPSKSMMSCSNRSTAQPPTLHTSAGSFLAIMAGPKPIQSHHLVILKKEITSHPWGLMSSAPKHRTAA